MKSCPLIILLCQLLFLAQSFGSKESNSPNIILFLVDDMGLMDTSVPMLVDNEGKPKRYPLNDWYRTPNMERLAKQGIRFSQFYAQSVCSPTRASIMTGQNSARHRVSQFISPEKRNAGPNGWRWEGLTQNDVTLPSILKQAGYQTIFAGKAHFAPIGHEGEDPTKLGFDINIAGCSFGRPGSYYGEDGYGKLNPKQKKRAVPGLGKYHKTDTFLSEAITLEAKYAIDQSLNKKKPFFLYMSHYAVHSPFHSDPRFADNYKDSGKSKGAQAYATLIEGIDKSLGDLMDHVSSKGVAENTLVLFVGDNGSDAPLGSIHGYSSSAPLRGKKGTYYEGGMRVPFIAGWTKTGKGNSFPVAKGALHNEQIGTVMDLYSTILETAGAKNPSDHVVDGISLLKQLSGKTNPDRPDHFMCHFPHSHRSSYFTSYRKGDWKLIYRYKGKSKYVLYDLSRDPFEKRNLAEDEPEKLKQMTKGMIAQLETENALYPVEGESMLMPILP
ncbi:MAG: sulfatase [Opitutae bacterium]